MDKERNMLQNLLKVIKCPHVFIQMHNYPDQDAIASAAGLQELLALHNISSTICYKGQIDKFNTLKMLELLQIRIYDIDTLRMGAQDQIILIDAQKGNVNIDDFTGNEAACIDHHPIFQDCDYLFSDIRPSYGACASIIASYFFENLFSPSEKTATALLYGIKMDTDNLSRMLTNTDIDMFCFLMKLADLALLKKLESSTICINDLQTYVKAISHLNIQGQVVFTNIGNDCSEAMLGTVSDFLLALSEISISVVCSYRAGGLKFSLRSKDEQFDAGKIIQTALAGIGDGGGHPTMAGGFVPDIRSEYDAGRTAKYIKEKILKLVANTF